MKKLLSFAGAAIVIALGVTGYLFAQESSDEENSKPVIYQGTALIDGVGDDIRQNMSIVVVDELITAVVPTAELTGEMTKDAEIVDASEWYALPGLVESHTHIATRPNRQYAEFMLNRQLYSGITIARDLAGDARALSDLSRASLVQEIPAPDLKFVALMAGPSFFDDPRTISSGLGVTPGEVSWMQAVTEESDMQTAVAYARGTWATAIKTYAALNGKTIKLIADEARRQGILVWSHTQVGPAGPMEVASAGVRSMSHVTSLCAAAIPEDVQAQADRGEISGFVDVDVNSPKIDAVLQEMKRHDVVFDVTLLLYSEMEKAMAAEEGERSSEAEEGERSSEEEADDNRRRRRGIRAKCGLQDAYDLTRRAHAAGVRISTGTDAWSGKESEFPALYDELRLLNENVGIPMIDVLKASSVNGSYSVGMEDQAGTITVGKLANIMFVAENPLDGVDSLQSVVLTVKRGTPYYRKDFVLGSPGDVDQF